MYKRQQEGRAEQPEQHAPLRVVQHPGGGTRSGQREQGRARREDRPVARGSPGRDEQQQAAQQGGGHQRPQQPPAGLRAPRVRQSLDHRRDGLQQAVVAHRRERLGVRAQQQGLALAQVERFRRALDVQRMPADALENPATVFEALFGQVLARVSGDHRQQVRDRDVGGDGQVQCLVRGAHRETAQPVQRAFAHGATAFRGEIARPCGDMLLGTCDCRAKRSGPLLRPTWRQSAGRGGWWSRHPMPSPEIADSQILSWPEVFLHLGLREHMSPRAAHTPQRPGVGTVPSGGRTNQCLLW